MQGDGFIRTDNARNSVQTSEKRDSGAVERKKSASRPAGLEPATYGLGNRCDTPATNDNATTCGNDAEYSADYLALLELKSPDLALLVKRWDTLPDAVRAGIMAMVRASNQTSD